MAVKKIKGRIIRIIDTKTVIINLGGEQGVTDSSMFYILGEPEEIQDPLTNEILGSVNVTKSKVKASQVFDKFTIATTNWTKINHSILSGMLSTTETIDEGDLLVRHTEIEPWKARSATPVRIGDEVEVQVRIDEPTEADVKELGE